MRRELQGKDTLQLYNNIRAIWIASLNDVATPDGDEANRRMAQSDLRQLVRSVPWLTGNLVDRITRELGSDQVCLPDRERTVDLDGLPDILATMHSHKKDPTCQATGTGMFMLQKMAVDPNVAVAIARLQGSDLYKVPSQAGVTITLKSMGVTFAETDLLALTDSSVSGND